MTKPKKMNFRKKLLTTTQYIYQALYKEELNSDITVLALGKTWKLHKVYLCQSSYFASMFGGSWRETNQDFVNIEIIDPKINIDGMFVRKVFNLIGSFKFGKCILSVPQLWKPYSVRFIWTKSSLNQKLLSRCWQLLHFFNLMNSLIVVLK